MKKRLFVSSLLTMVMIFTAIGLSYSQTIYGCVSKSGALRIVSGAGQCKKTETPISWAQNGPQGPQGPKGDKGDQGPSFWVYDNIGQRLGTLIDGDPYLGLSTVFDPVSSKFIFVNTNGWDPQSWDNEFETMLLFQDGLCSGIPLVRQSDTFSTFLKGDDWAYWNSGKFYTILVDKLITVDVTNPKTSANGKGNHS